MKCRNVSSLLSAYIDNELSVAESLGIQEHLHSCTSCQFEAQRLAAIKDSLAGLRMFEPPAGLEHQLRDAVLAAPIVSRRTLTFAGLLVASSLAGALLAVRLARPVVPDQPIAHQTTHDYQVAADRAYISSDPISGGPSVVSVNYASGD